MKPITFPEQNTTWAENQPPYLPLPAYTDARTTVLRWSLTLRERLHVLVHGKLWLSQANFGESLQPVSLGIESPFEPQNGGKAST
jgi:hypothetical protein